MTTKKKTKFVYPTDEELEEIDFEKYKEIVKNISNDPSGLDMDRDTQDRLNEFGVDVEVIRIGLTMEQIKRLNPPTNPAKITDPRATNYIEKFGAVSWEVDAIPPEELQQLIEERVLEVLDSEKYSKIEAKESEDIKQLKVKE